MAAPSADKESNTILMVVEKWAPNQVEQFSAVHRIGGYPWRLRLSKKNKHGVAYLELICDKSREAVLWKCKTTIHAFLRKQLMIPQEVYKVCSFNCWEFWSSLITVEEGLVIKVTIEPKSDGESWRRRPILDASDPLDGIFVIGNEKKKIHVNKEFLASQSSFFDRLFNGDFKEKNMKEIPIGDVEYEEFTNIIKLVCDMESGSITDDNFRRVLELADRFDLKIIEDKVSFFILSSSSFSTHQKLLVSEQYNLPFVKENILPLYNSKDSIRKLCEFAEADKLSAETMFTLLKMSLNLRH